MKVRGLSAVVLAGALLLSGCGDGASESDSAASTNDDVGAEDAARGTAGVGDASEVTESAADEVTDAESDAAADGENASSAQNDAAKDDDTSGTPSEQEEFSYPDEPEPAPEVAATLCNLDSDYFENLRPTNASGDAVVDDSLRMSVLSLGDNLSLWIDLQRSFPEVEDDVARAQKIYDAWDEALLLSENGDDAGAAKSMASAEAQIDRLSSKAPSSVVEVCSS